MMPWLRIENIAPVAHLHLGLEMGRLEMIVADLEHVPKVYVRISAMAVRFAGVMRNG